MLVGLITMAVASATFFMGLVLSAKLLLWAMIPPEDRAPDSSHRNRIKANRTGK